MKKFSQFISEAQSSLASIQARRLGLVADGHGGWYDRKTGEFTAKTEGGRLKFYNQNQVVGGQDPKQIRTPANQRVTAAQSAPVKKSQLKTEDTVTFTFGRFNPPTLGHKRLLDVVSETAGDGEYRIYPSRSNDFKKNPLDVDTKIAVMQKMYPEHSEYIVNNPETKTIIDVLVSLSEEGYKKINIVVGSDRLSEFEKLANQYNGTLYNFEELNLISAGDRDSQSSGIDGISSSKVRKAVAEKDYKTYRNCIPNTLNESDAKTIYNVLRKSMNLEEDWEVWEIAPKFDWKNLRENYISGKIFRVNEWVENLNTGLIGKIIRRGANYLICVTEDNIMFKPWIRDVVEVSTHNIEVPSKNIKKLVKKAVNNVDDNIDGFVDDDDKKVGPYGAFLPQLKNTPKGFKEEWTEVSGVPADQREVGTDAFREYVMRMTNTKKIDNFSIKKFINKYKKK